MKSYPFVHTVLFALLLVLVACTQAPTPQVPDTTEPTLSSQAQFWRIATLDSSGDVGRYPSIALDSLGNPVISYLDWTNSDLKLLHCGDATCSSGNSVVTVDSAGQVGYSSSLVLDSSGRPVIAYSDETNRDLKLARCGDANCSSGNTIVTVDTAGGAYPSLVLDSSGKPVISYRIATSPNYGLGLAHCGNATCTSGNSIVMVDSGILIGEFTSLVLDGRGNPAIAYRGSTDAFNLHLKLAHCGDPDCSSGNTTATVYDEGGVASISLKLDSIGNPVISFNAVGNPFSGGPDTLKLAHCGNASCTSANSVVTVESMGFSVGFGADTSLELDDLGNPLIAYYKTGDLALVRCGDANCSSGNTIEIVDPRGTTGFYASLALDKGGNPVISYYNYQFDQDLLVARWIADDTPPDITPQVTGTLGDNDWYSSNVSVSWAVTDGESAISGQTGCDTRNVTTDTTSMTFSCEATSSGGTASESVTIKRDATNPTIAFVSRTPANAAGWNNTDVTLNWSCSDETSGAVNANVSQTVGSEGAGQSATGTCTDNAGNSVSDTQTGINIDKTAPTLNPVVTPNPVLLNASASVVSNANDVLSDLATQSCGLLDTSSVGTKSVSCSATDNAGNSASASASYQVIYNFAGFFSPVDNLPTLNQVKAGQAIPVKFSLAGNQGLNILASGSPSSQTIGCSSGAAVDDIEETVTAGNSSLSYDAATNTYSYIWKTQKGWAGTCRQLIVTLVDGTQHLANFKFR